MSVSRSLLLRPRTSSSHERLLSLALFALCAAFALADEAFAGQAVLTWDPPTTNADGTPLTDLAGYEVHYGTVPRDSESYVYPGVQNVGNTTTATIALADPVGAPSTSCFAVKAVDMSGNKSVYSNEVCKTIQPPTQYPLTIKKSGTGSGTVTGSGINCGADCTEPFNQGVPVTLSAAAAIGSTFSGWTGGPCTGAGQCVVTMNSDTTVIASFDQASTTFTVTASAGTGGSISPSGNVTVNQGATKAFTVTPATGYRISSVTGCGGTLSGNTYTTGPINANCTVTASFAANTFTVTASAGTGGSISPSGNVTVDQGATKAFTVTPATGYRISSVTGCGGTLSGNTYTTGPINANCTVTASFGTNTFTVTASAGTGGSISPSGNITVSQGASQVFSIAPSTGFRVADVSVDGSSVGAVSSYTLSNVAANHTISATFVTDVTMYVITASAGVGGTISPSGAISVATGSNQAFTITPSSGYAIADVVVDGVSRGPIAGYYTFTNITANHTISATFSPVPNISPSYASYTFGKVKVRWSKSGMLSLYNKGGSQLIISSVALEGTDKGMFSITRTYGSKTVAPSGSYSVRVSFRPSSAGAKTAVLRVTSNDPDTPVLDIPLAGVGY